MRIAAPLPDLVPAAPDWPAVTVQQEVRDGAPAPTHAVDAQRASIAIAPGMHAEIDRAGRSATLVTDRPWADEVVAHPFLAAPGAVFAWWDGREPLHGGAFVAGDGGAWVVLAGPHCLDLRPDAAARLGLAAPPGDDPRRTKVRLRLPAGPATAPLAGVVHLAWGDRVEAVAIDRRERLARLVPHRSTWREPSAPGAFLDLLAVPAYELRRPRDERLLDDVAGALLALQPGG